MGTFSHPLFGVCSEAPWIICTVGVAAVVLGEVSGTQRLPMKRRHSRLVKLPSTSFKIDPDHKMILKRYSLAFEVLGKKRMVMGELGVPALTRHTLWSDIHGALVIRAHTLDAGRCDVEISVSGS